MSAKCDQQSMILTYQICVLNLWSLQGPHDSTSFYQQTFRKIHYTNWSNYPYFKNECEKTVVMWPLFIKLIVSFCIKRTQQKLCNTGKTQGISFWL